MACWYVDVGETSHRISRPCLTPEGIACTPKMQFRTPFAVRGRICTKIVLTSGEEGWGGGQGKCLP